jgi:hypothetical protein
MRAEIEKRTCACAQTESRTRLVCVMREMAGRPPWSPSLLSGSTNDFVTYYFHAGHPYKTILQFLCVVHGMVLSLRQLKRKLKGLGLRRRAPRTAANLRLVSRLVWVSNCVVAIVANGIFVETERAECLRCPAGV